MQQEIKPKKLDGSALVFLFLAVLICVESLNLEIGTLNAPKSGFFPFILGVSLGLLSILWLLIHIVRRGTLEWVKVSISWKRAMPMLGGLMAYALLLDFLGFSLATFLLVFLLVRAIESRPWWVAGLVGIGIVSFMYTLFLLWLRVQLPTGWLGF